MPPVPDPSESKDGLENFVYYPVASSVLKYIRKCIGSPNAFRPEGLTIVGPANNGKTWLLRKSVQDLHSELWIPRSDSIHQPIVFIRAPVKASRRKFFADLCGSVNAPYSAKMNIDVLSHRACLAMRDAGVRGIFIDEIQHLVAGTRNDCSALLDDIKELSCELGIPIIAAGTIRAYQAIKRDEQYLSRFPPIELPIWALDENFVALLRDLESRLCIQPGAIANPEVGELICIHSRGLLGRIIGIIKTAKEEAESDGSPEITADHINAAGFRDLPWGQAI